MHIKKIYISLFVLVLTILIVNGQNENSLTDIEKAMRCIPNNKCDYFESEETCPSDCNLEALQQQRTEDAAIQNTGAIEPRATSTNRIITTNNQKPFSRITFWSISFIILFLLLVMGLYFWIHYKAPKRELVKKNLFRPVASIGAKRILSRTQTRRLVYAKPSYLPKRPTRRF